MKTYKMLKLFRFIAVQLLLAPAYLWAQTPPPITTQQIIFPFSQSLQLATASVNLIGNPGNATYRYWIVTNYTVGSTSPVFVGKVESAPNTLSGSNYVSIFPSYPLGALSVDILRTTTHVQPSGACNCAVATGVTSATANDQSNNLNSYTVTPVNLSALTATIDNEPISAGVSHLIYKQNGVVVADLSIPGGAPVGSVFGRLGTVVAASGDYSVGQITGAAPLASPAFTGIPTAPTATLGDSSTQIASDAFVAAGLASKAPLASPTFTGTATFPALISGKVNGGVAVDGSTNLTIASAVAAASSGGTVTIPPGTYTLASTVTVGTANVNIQCAPGVVILGASAAVTPLIKLNATGTGIHWCQLQGQAIDGSTVQLAIEVGTVSAVSVTDNTISGPDLSHGFNVGIQLDTGSAGVSVERNFVTGLFGTLSGTGYGVLMIATNYDHILNNRISFSATQGRHQIYVSQASTANEVADNFIDGGTNTMIALYATDSQGGGVRDNNVHDNTLRNGLNPGGTGVGGAINLSNNVSHNKIHDNVVDTMQNGPGIELWDAGGVTAFPINNEIQNNKIKDPGTYGIGLIGASNTLVSGNRISNCGLLTSNTYDCIIVQGDGGSLFANNNQIKNNYAGGGVAHYALNILATAPIATGTEVSGNTLDLGLSGTLNDAGAATKFGINNVNGAETASGLALGSPVIGGGSPLNFYKAATDTPGIAVINAGTCTDRGVTVSGALTSGVVTATANYALEANLILSPGQLVAGTAHYKICNFTASNITTAPGATFNIEVFQ